VARDEQGRVVNNETQSVALHDTQQEAQCEDTHNNLKYYLTVHS